MELTVKEIGQVLNALERKIEKDGVTKFQKEMQKKREEDSQRFPVPLSRSSIYRLVAYRDGDLSELYHSQPRTLKDVCKFLDETNQLNESFEDLRNRFGFVEDYLKTENTKYAKDDFYRLTGNYDMYRRYWIKRDRSLFMRSRVSIRKFKPGFYLFSERQWWPEQGYKEHSRGYLFPSANAVIAVCEAIQGQNTKFISISDFDPPLSDFGGEVQTFSGSAIASADVAPHFGYGFHCVRSNKVMKSCNVIHISDIKQEILKNILHNENYIVDKNDLNEKQLEFIFGDNAGGSDK